MSQYPSSFDTDVEIPRIEDNITESGAETINAMRSAIFNLQRALGINPQGSANDLNTRISQSLNEDGTLKTAALILNGIVNSDIANNAAIVESKLDLDVATQFLQDQVTSNDIDIAELQQSIAQIISNFARHVAGTAFNHDSFDIFLDSNYPGSTPPAFTDLTSDNVGDTIIEINDRFLDHADSAKINAHRATNISVDGSNFRTISTNVNDVQEALEELDTARAIESIKHRDHYHANGFDNWANNIDGYNRFLQLVPSVYGNATVAQIIPGTTSQIRFDGINLASLGVVQGSVVVILDGDASGQYIVDDVGPRATIGTKPSLNQDELEISGAFINAELIVDGYVNAQIFGQSSVFTFKSNVASTFHQSSSTLDSVQLSRPNSAKVITLGLKPHLIDGTEQLDLEVGVGSGLNRTISISNLNEDRIGPVSSVTVDTIVDKINSVFQSSAAFPASAYRVGDELCISHNWDESREFYLKIINSTAVTVLGFDGYGADVVDKEIYPTHMSKFYVNGYEHTEFATILEDTAVASGTTVTFDSVNPAAAGVKVGHLLHVVNHATASEMGTYFVTSVSSTAVSVHESITAGAISVKISHDAIPLHELANTTNSLIVQCFLDSSGQSHYNLRSSYDKTITNLDVIDVSDNFLAGTYSLSSTSTSGGHLLQLDAGIEVFVPTGFVGQKIIFGDSNVEWIAVNIVGILSTGTAVVTINKHIDEEEILEVSSVMTNGLETLFNVRDKRLFGNIGQDELREDVIQNYIENPLVELRSNGVVRGFDIINANEVDPVYPGFKGVLVRGGTAYVDGVRNDVRTSVVVLQNLAGTFFICLNKLGNYVIINESDSSLNDILSGHAGAILPIAEVTHNGTAITEAIDRRYFVNNLDAKVDLIADLTNHMIGSFASFEAAIAFANNYPSDEKFFIRVTSRTTNPLTIPSGSRDLVIELDGYVGSLYVNSNCLIRSRSLTQRGTFHIQQGVFVDDGCTRVELRGLSIDGGIIFNGSEALNFSAYNCYVEDPVNFVNEAMLSCRLESCVFQHDFLDSTSPASTLSIDCLNCTFFNSIIEIPASTAHVRFFNCVFDATGLYAGTNSTLIVDYCRFINFNSSGMMIQASNRHAVISSTTFENSIFTAPSGTAVQLNSESSAVIGCVFDSITIPNSMKLLVLSDNGIISSCTFKELTVSSSATSIIESAQISGCTYTNGTGEVAVKVTEAFTDNIGFHNINVATGGMPKSISGNVFPQTTSLGSNIVLDSTLNSQCVIGQNTFNIAANGIGIQFSGNVSQVKITDNHFQCKDVSGIGIDLSSGSSKVVISQNTFTNGYCLSTSSVLSDTIFTENLIDGDNSAEVSLSLDRNVIIGNNICYPVFEVFGAGASNVIIDSNYFYNSFILGAELSDSIVSRNRFDDGYILDGYFIISASLSNCIVSENISKLHVNNSVTFEGIQFISNNFDLVVVAGESTIQNITWKDSKILNNTFGKNQSVSTQTNFTLFSSLSNDPSNVIISENTFNHNVSLSAADIIVNAIFSENVGVPSTGNSYPVFSSTSSLNGCQIIGNLKFSLNLEDINIDNTIISSNISVSSSTSFERVVINNTLISNNFVERLAFHTIVSSSGLVILNNIATDSLKFCHAGATSSTTDVVGAVVSSNQSPSIYIGYQFTSSLTNSITNSIFSSNLCNEMRIIANSRSGTVSIFTNNVVTSNQINGNFSFLSEAAGSVYNNASNNFSDNIFSNNYVNGEFLIGGGSSSATDNVLIKNLLITQNTIRGGFRKAAYVSLEQVTIASNNIFDELGPSILFSYNGVSAAATKLALTDVIITANSIFSETGQGIVVDIPGSGLSSSSSITRLYVSGNIMPNMDINLTLSSNSSNADLNVGDVSIINNSLRTVVFRNTSSVSSSIYVVGLNISNNSFNGDVAGTGLHASATWERGVYILFGSTSASDDAYKYVNISDNTAGTFSTSPFDIKISKKLGSHINEFNDAVFSNNINVNIFFESSSTSTAYRLSLRNIGISYNNGIVFDNSTITSLSRGSISGLNFIGNRFISIILPAVDCWGTGINVSFFAFNSSAIWSCSAGTLSTAGNTYLFPWGNTGFFDTSVVFGGTTATNVATANGTSITC